jgi:glutaredoxin
VAEIPAFIYFLNRRKMVTQRDSRAWFDFDLIKTNALKKVLDLSKSEIQKEIEFFMRETFSQINAPVLKYSTRDIQSEIRSTKYTTIQIRDCLTLKMKVEDSKWSNPYTVLKWDETRSCVQKVIRKSIFYKFYFSDYFEIHEVVELLKGHQLVELEEELKKANKKAIYPQVTTPMLMKNERVKKAMQKKRLNVENIESLRLSMTSFAEIFFQLS